MKQDLKKIWSNIRTNWKSSLFWICNVMLAIILLAISLIMFIPILIYNIVIFIKALVHEDEEEKLILDVE